MSKCRLTERPDAKTGPAASVLFRPTGSSSPLRRLAPLLRRHLRSACLPALQAAPAPQLDRGGVLACVGVRIVSLAGSEVHDELAELVGVAWALARAVGHGQIVALNAGVLV